MCGYDLDSPKRRRRPPIADFVLAAGILVIIIFWWRWDSDQRAIALTPTVTLTATLTPTATVTGTTTPTPTLSPTPTLTPTPILYTVVSGDTYFGIAGNFDISVQSLLQANSLSEDAFLGVNQVLEIPKPTPTPYVPPTATPTPARGQINYRVQRGDTLNAIAIRFQVDVGEIVANNDIANPDSLVRGTVLVIPLGPEIEQAVEVTPTPTPGYSAPHIIGPPDGSDFPIIPPPLLRWVSVGLLADDVWYEVVLDYADRSLSDPSPLLTKGTSLRLDSELTPPTSATVSDILWHVRLVQVLEDGVIVAVSPSTTIRRLTWH